MKTPTVITHAEAKARALTRYFTGQPCVRGHVAYRTLASRGCVACAALAARQKRLLLRPAQERTSTARELAIASGALRYRTGKPCSRGHVAERLVSTRQCVECSRWLDRAGYAKNIDAQRDRALAYQHRRLPKPTRPRPDTCELCGGPPGKRRLHLDHDHQTGLFRGWLCHRCNLNLGRMGDSIESLQRALAYLERAAHVTLGR